MGEADLHPDGFHSTPPGLRIGSMMAPTVATTAEGDLIALGSGGSERIRSALMSVLIGLLDRGLPLAAAVRGPRLHWDRATLQVEPVSYTHLRAPETGRKLVCRLLLEKKK